MNPVAKKLTKYGLPLLVFAAAVGIAVLLVVTKEEPERQEKREQRVLVETAPIERGSHELDVATAGEVIAARDVRITPQVSGQIVWVNDKLVPGGIVREGETLFRVEPDDYRITVEEAQTQLAQAQAQLEQEKGRVEVAKREWELFKDEVPGEHKDAQLALRKPQLDSARVAVDAARARLKRARLNLRRTSVEAPFDAFVESESADLGQLVGTQSQVARLIGTDKFWVRLAVPVDKISYINVPGVNAEEGSPALIRQDVGERFIERRGQVVRLLGDLDRQGRMARVLIEIADPFGLGELEEAANPKKRGIPLLISSYVDVVVEGPTVDGLTELPREAIRDGDKAYVFSDERTLDIRKVEVVWERPESVLVRGGLEGAEKVVTSPLAAAIDGMKLRDESAEDEESSDASAPQEAGGDQPAEEASDE